jgi:hypothetical protein
MSQYGDHRDLVVSLDESKRQKAESETARLNAEIGLPPISGARSDGTQPQSDTADQQSRYRQMDWRDGGEDRSDNGSNSA